MSNSADVVSPNAPLRLRRAAELAFPGGGMTASGLRREAIRGRLVIERIAGKDYTTLAAIAKMRNLCRVPAKLEISVGRLNFTPERPISEHTLSFLVRSDVRLNGPLNLRERLRSDCAETDKANKARPISKREREALKLCFEARGTSIALSTHWPRTALWLVLHGFIQATGHDQRGNRIYRITPEGEAAWLAIAGGAAKD
ncbi:hypothetical protein ABID65_003268 [Bradyrhizobium sp. S3.9.2]|uniref:hypothetical protein n=1 Tax=Bradyrhizobium sp. S3.9.2 TaxID=3156432 RepID=UPI0033988BC3